MTSSNPRDNPIPKNDIYSIDFYNTHNNLSFSLPSDTKIKFQENNLNNHNYTFGDVFDFFNLVIDLLRKNQIINLLQLFNIANNTTNNRINPYSLVTLILEDFSEDVYFSTKVYLASNNEYQYRLLLDKSFTIKQVRVQNGNIMFSENPIIQKLNKRPESDPRLIACEEVFTSKITYDELQAEARLKPWNQQSETRFYKVLCITGRPWRFCEFWGLPDRLIKTESEAYPYAWVPKIGSQGPPGFTHGGSKRKRKHTKKHKHKKRKSTKR